MPGFLTRSSRPANPSLTFPIRAAFYYGWYDYSWDQQGYTPFTRYTPTLGAYYDCADPAVVDQHVRWMRQANIDAAICTWWWNNPDTNGSHANMAVMLDSAIQHGLKVCAYHELESTGNPSQATIETHLATLAEYTEHPAYLHVDDRPVIFVYTNNDGSSDVTGRWSAATDGFTTHYVSMSTFTGYASASPQPDSWHGYNPGQRVMRVTGESYNISPGYNRPDHVTPFLARDIASWPSDIASMVASGDKWHLITSFNEWGEGSQIEPSEELGSDWLDALG